MVVRPLAFVIVRRCGCPKPHPGSSGGMFVFVDDAAGAVTSVDAKLRDRRRVGDRFGKRA